MTNHHSHLSNLRNAFIEQMQNLCGKHLYTEKLQSRWGVYKRPGKKDNVFYIIERSQKDIDFPNISLPHLKISADNALAIKVSIKPDLVVSGRFHQQRHDAAYWCINRSDNPKFYQVANDISKLC